MKRGTNNAQCGRRLVACNVFRGPPAAPALLNGLPGGLPGAFGGVIPNGNCGEDVPPTTY